MEQKLQLLGYEDPTTTSDMVFAIIPEKVTINGTEYTVTSIGSSAFASCSSLTNIIIPNSVTSIGSYVFENCTNLTINVRASSQPSGWISSWNPSNRPVNWGYTGD